MEVEVYVVDSKKNKPSKIEAKENTAVPKRKKSSKRSTSSEKVSEPVQKGDEGGVDGVAGDESGEVESASGKILMVQTENLKHSSFEKTSELKVRFVCG